MDDYFSSHLKKTEEMNKTSADQQLYSQGLTFDTPSWITSN